MSRQRRMSGAGTILLATVLTMSVAAGRVAGAEQTEVQVDPLVVLDLPETSNSHWVWVNDIVFHHMADGKAFLLDGDKGTMLGMLSTGSAFNGVVLPNKRDGKHPPIYSPELYFSRGTRGTRSDLVTIYDGKTLKPLQEIPVAGKRVVSMPMLANARLTDDDRFLLIYNFTPAQSISVVDMASKQFVGEIEIAGCALVYPTGPRGFFSLCSDGTAMQVQLDESGRAASKAHSKHLFDPQVDPVTEKAVRDGNTWLFATFAGSIVPIDVSGAVPRALPSWSLLNKTDRKESWRPGGAQHLALHGDSRRLYSLMHVGGEDTHKDPGTEVWVYDLRKKQRTQRIELKEIATAIAVTADANPLMFTIFIGSTTVNVYDAMSGSHLRSIAEIGFTPSTLVTY